MTRAAPKIPAPPEQSYRFLIDSLEDYGILMLDTKGRIVGWNEGAKKIFGYTEKEVLGKSVAIIFSASDRKIKIPALEMSTARHKGRADDERQHRRKDGSLFWATGVMWAIKNDQGKIEGLSKLIRDISKQKAMEDVVRHQSLHDILTGLPNRRDFKDRFALILKKAAKDKTEFGVIYLDLDDFKKVNDTLGHDTGDILLTEVATRLSSALRKGDVVCRVGGDEFVLLIDNIASSQGIRRIVKRIQSVFVTPFDISNKKIKIRASLGVAMFPSDGKTAHTLEKRADIALYRAKAAGKNRYKMYKDQ